MDLRRRCATDAFTGSTRGTYERGVLKRRRKETHLDETDGGRLFAEALTAEVKAVFADETGLVRAEAAGRGACVMAGCMHA